MDDRTPQNLAIKPFTSKHLSEFQMRSLIRLGDVYVPGTDRLPSFSKSGCIQHLDIVLDGVHPDDVRSMRWLLVGLRIMPAWVLLRLMDMMDRHNQFAKWIAAPLRLVSLAIKGVVMSLYYSGLPIEGSQSPTVLELIGYQLHCEADEVEGERDAASVR